MPEGDTIHRTAAGLRALVGQTVTSARAMPGPGVRRVADLSRLVGATITSVESRGKQLLVGFDNGLTIRSHLRMTGSWRLFRVGEPWRRSAHRASAVIETPTAVAVAFDTPVVELLTAAELRRSPQLIRQGPDLLADPFDIEEAVRRLRARDRMELGTALLDQRAIAGIGNVYKSEIAFLERVDPWSPVSAFDDERLRSIVQAGRRLLMSNVGTGPRTTTGRLTRGQSLWVYGRRGRPCRRCGAAILGRQQGEQARLTYWCPRCQPPPTRSP